MKPHTKIFLLIFTMGGFLLCHAEQAHSDDDGQYWNEFILNHDVTPQWETHLKLEQRFVNNFGNLGLHNYAPGISYTFTKYFVFELNYKFEREKGGNTWTGEHRLEMIPLFKWRWSKFDFKLRNRLEYRNLEGGESWRLREKIKIARIMNINGFVFKPYFSEETFYDFKIGGFNQNRMAAGFSKEINRNLEFGLYYLYKTNKKRNDWSGANVLGTEFIITF